MRGFNIALVAVLATAGLGATAEAREVPANPAPNAQVPAAQQPAGKHRVGRHLRRVGTSTAGSDSFLPALGGLLVQLGATGTIAATGGLGSDLGPASPE